MASGVEELLDMLFEMVDEAKNMPLSSDKCVLERDRALDLIDDIRAQFPVELGEAKKLVASRNDYIAAAKREAEVIRKQAEAEAQRMLAEESVLNQAKQRSAEIDAPGGGAQPGVEALRQRVLRGRPAPHRGGGGGGL